MNKRTVALVASLMFAVACPGDETTDPPVPTDIAPECAQINSAFPAPDATGVYYRVTLSWEFSEADTSTSVVVTGPSGEVAGAGMWLNNTYIWEPAAPLDASTTYTAVLSYCDGANNPETSFTTSAVGSAVDFTGLQDKTFALEIGVGSQANVIDPPGIGAVLQQQFDANDIDILIGVSAVDASNITLLGALGDGASPLAQSQCAPSIPFPEANFSENPYFAVGPQDLTMSLAGATFTFIDLEINGAFNGDGSAIAGATLSGSMDTRELVPALAAGGADTAVCEMAAPFGVLCEACADGSGDFCLSALITNIDASEVSGLTLTTISSADVAANGDCVMAE